MSNRVKFVLDFMITYTSKTMDEVRAVDSLLFHQIKAKSWVFRDKVTGATYIWVKPSSSEVFHRNCMYGDKMKKALTDIDMNDFKKV